MGLVGKTNAEKIWNYLKAAGLSDCGAAGLMGNLKAESGLNPMNLQNSYERKLGYSDADYTVAVDNGIYDGFVNDKAGYGLAQWTYWSRKQALLAHVRSRNASIGDLEAQLSFLMKELAGYSGMMDTLKTAKTVKQASDKVLLDFERPADQSETAKARRAGFGQEYYKQFAKKEIAIMTEKEQRAKVVAIAEKYLGCKESDGSHRKIIDRYNAHKPLARGYPVKYTDEWCATFVSAVFIEAGLTSIAPTECGCGKMIDLYKKLGSWVENDAYVPKPGDVIMYDWEDSGVGDNLGAPNHVGIVASVSGNSVKIIEGNKGEAVAYRTLKVNGKYIRGYCVPKYAGASSAAKPNPPEQNTGSSKPAGNIKAGDIVDFIGRTHFSSSNAASGVPCRPGKAKVTSISLKGKHPYHLIAEKGGGSNVYGWVNAADIGRSTGSGSSTYTVVAGDSLWRIAQKRLGNGARYKEIADLNGLKPNSVIVPGQVLKIPQQ